MQNLTVVVQVPSEVIENLSKDYPNTDLKSEIARFLTDYIEHPMLRFEPDFKIWLRGTSK